MRSDGREARTSSEPSGSRPTYDLRGEQHARRPREGHRTNDSDNLDDPICDLANDPNKPADAPKLRTLESEELLLRTMTRRFEVMQMGDIELELGLGAQYERAAVRSIPESD